jgi:hypothetical protein
VFRQIVAPALAFRIADARSSLIVVSHSDGVSVVLDADVQRNVDAVRDRWPKLFPAAS